MDENTFLNYYKTVLEKVSFDQFLLNKEYQKALQTIAPSDHSKLDQWLYENGLKQKLKAGNELN